MNEHIGLIMDGNRTWAKKHIFEAWKGHEKGKEALKNLIIHFSKHSEIKYLTLYAMSLDNFTKRSEIEKKFLYNVFKQGFTELIDENSIFDNKVKIEVIGKWHLIPDTETKQAIQNAIDATKEHTNKTVTFAIAYDGQDELIEATRKTPETATKEEFKKNLFTKDLPPVDLVIRTGGQKRLSGFLLWDTSYAELDFTETLFPEFTTQEFDKAIEDYKSRQRRFGK